MILIYLTILINTIYCQKHITIFNTDNSKLDLDLETNTCYEVSGEKLKGVDVSSGYQLKFFDSTNCEGVYHAFGSYNLLHVLGNKKDIKSVKVLNEFGLNNDSNKGDSNKDSGNGKESGFLMSRSEYIEFLVGGMISVI